MIINTQYIEAISVKKMEEDESHVDSNIIIYINTTRTVFCLPWDTRLTFIWELWSTWGEELERRLELLN